MHDTRTLPLSAPAEAVRGAFRDVGPWMRQWGWVTELRATQDGVRLAFGGPRPLAVVVETRDAAGTLSVTLVRGELRTLWARFVLVEGERDCSVEAELELDFPVVIPASLEAELQLRLLPTLLEALREVVEKAQPEA